MSRKELFERVRRVNSVADGVWKALGTNVVIRGFKGIGLLDLHHSQMDGQ